MSFTIWWKMQFEIVWKVQGKNDFVSLEIKIIEWFLQINCEITV